MVARWFPNFTNAVITDGLLHVPLLQLLLLELVLDIGTEGHRALRLLAVFCVITAQRYELFAYWTAAVRLSLAHLRVRYHSLHLLAARQATVGVPALARVNQRLYATLYRQFPSLLGVALTLIAARRRAVVQVQAQLFHPVGVAVLLDRKVNCDGACRKLMRNTHLIIALYAEIKVVASGAVVSRLNVGPAVVARVDKLVLTLVVQLVEHRHRAEFGTTQRRELVVFFTSHCEEGIASIHEIAVNEGIRVLYRL